jgi:hypothetical protein
VTDRTYENPHGFNYSLVKYTGLFDFLYFFPYDRAIVNSEAGQSMGLSRKQIREGLEQVPVDRILGVSGELTAKQKKFAYGVAMGETKAEAYRKAYKAKPAPSTIVTAPYTLAADPRIQREIEAYKLANEAAKHRTAAQLRDLVIQSLVQVVIDPDAKHSAKISAARVLGTVTEVAAFTEQKVTRIIKSSEDARTQIMQQLRDMMKAGATDAIEIDAAELLEELSPTLDEVAEDDPAATPPPDYGGQESHSGLHTIPLKGSQEIDPTPIKNSDSYNAR